MWLMFQSTFTLGGYPNELIGMGVAWLSNFVADTMAQMMAVGNTEMGAYMMNEITNTQIPISFEKSNTFPDLVSLTIL